MKNNLKNPENQDNKQQKDLFKVIFTGFLVFVFFGFFLTYWFVYREELSVAQKIVNNELKSSTNTSQITKGFDVSLIEQGCPRKDCIPSIDQPQFESVNQAEEWLTDEDLIFGINSSGVTRAYPQRILNWHEIVNDNLNGYPVAITFCPLCGSAISFERLVDGKTTTFGVSGKLFNSNLIMYDRLQENYWQQETGVAIVGEAAERNEELVRVPMIVDTWSEWKQKFPDSEILSRETGFTRDYNIYPYGTYEQDGEIYFGIQNQDERLPLKEPGFGFELDNKFKFYRQTDLDKVEFIEDEFAGQQVKINNRNGEVTMTIQSSEKILIPIRTFWFAFAAFHPGTEIYNTKS